MYVYITELGTVNEVSVKLRFMFSCPVEMFCSCLYKINVLKQ
jgi:hypothetical protein